MTDSDVLRVTDSAVLAALANPARRRLLDLLRVDGPSTTGQLADRSGLAVGSVSHHIRFLVRSGLVDEAPERSRDRRQSWWTATTQRIRWERAELSGTPADEAIVTAAESLGLDRQYGLARQWLAVQDDHPGWLQAAFSTDAWLKLTPGELSALRCELDEVVDRYRRIAEEGDAVARDDVFVLARGFPARP